MDMQQGGPADDRMVRSLLLKERHTSKTTPHARNAWIDIVKARAQWRAEVFGKDSMAIITGEHLLQQQEWDRRERSAFIHYTQVVWSLNEERRHDFRTGALVSNVANPLVMEFAKFHRERVLQKMGKIGKFTNQLPCDVHDKLGDRLMILNHARYDVKCGVCVLPRGPGSLQLQADQYDRRDKESAPNRIPQIIHAVSQSSSSRMDTSM
jgi:hypothetical protein